MMTSSFRSFCGQTGFDPLFTRVALNTVEPDVSVRTADVGESTLLA